MAFLERVDGLTCDLLHHFFEAIEPSPCGGHDVVYVLIHLVEEAHMGGGITATTDRTPDAHFANFLFHVHVIIRDVCSAGSPHPSPRIRVILESLRCDTLFLLHHLQE